MDLALRPYQPSSSATTARPPSQMPKDETPDLLGLPEKLRHRIFEFLFRLRGKDGFPELSVLETCNKLNSEAREVLRDVSLTINVGNRHNPNWETRPPFPALAPGPAFCVRCHDIHEWRAIFKMFKKVRLEIRYGNSGDYVQHNQICALADIFSTTRESRQKIAEWPKVRLIEYWHDGHVDKSKGIEDVAKELKWLVTDGCAGHQTPILMEGRIDSLMMN